MVQDPGNGYAQPVVAAGSLHEAAEKPTPNLGILSLTIVGTCLLITIAILVTAILLKGSVPPLSNQQVATRRQVGDLLVLLAFVTGLVGFAGWVTGLVATAKDPGSMFGTAAIMTGLLAPFISFYALLTAMALSLTFGNG
jgi:hypothetical protein